MAIPIDPSVWLKDVLLEAGLSLGLSTFISTVAVLLFIALLSWISNLVAKAIINKVVTRIVKNSKTQWDDVFLEQKVFSRMSHFAPALVIWFLSAWALKPYLTWMTIVHNLTYIYMVLIGMVVLNSFIESWHIIYQMHPISKHRSIKGYVQLVKIFVILLTILVIISVLFKRDVLSLLTGIGVVASVLILVFKDTLLGLVASIQLSADKMLKVGDWISINSREVDGVVTDISLNTIKVQNFDKTIITVPTYALVQDSFQNWRGMEEAGVRRIKRPLFIDMKSIKFIEGDLRDRLCRIHELKDYIEKYEKENSIQSTLDQDTTSPFFKYNKLTNLSLFRYYGETWLKNHPSAAKDQLIILRNRVQVDNGLPLEVVVFSNNPGTVEYENFQNEIFEHFFGILKEFDLKVFQHPTGNDMIELISSKR